ncbi:MAG TPA: bifunctional methylenetetrahydrofolate dehydrogenase/methenyltetrahydrofolate cyclohydrolase FolD [Stellaceae bacterium]|nr:bifunctional methylenetetrahydrofolate dehydrogenase/methenyltetrahydrofolate cyclohydrolase FolD [Stellaceae bacterium]
MVETRVIDGKAIAQKLRAVVAASAAALKTSHGLVPGLATVLVGENPASEVYVRSKQKAAQEAGFRSFEHRLGADVAQADLVALVRRLNEDPAIDGVLVQLPLPGRLDARRVIDALDPQKDVDGFHARNVGLLWSGEGGHVPCTPLGCLMLLRSALPSLAGLEAVVLGRSTIVGKPMAALLLGADCTVTVAHSKTRDLPALCRRADILVAAIGRAETVRGNCIKPGATVIDVGINRVEVPGGKPRLVGDVAFAEAQGVAAAITPVPGGVGPMTIACLLRNTLVAACRRRGLPEPSL